MVTFSPTHRRFRRRFVVDALTDLVPLEPAPAEWTWLLADESGVIVPGPVLSFASQSAAEEWLTEHFGELAEDGVDAVTLFDGEHAVYGPMPLAAG